MTSRSKRTPVKLRELLELTLLERILIPGILSKKADHKTLIINKDILAKIIFTQDEIKKYDIEQVADQVKWNVKGTKATFHYEFTDLERLELKLAMQKLDTDKELTMELLPLYEKVIKLNG